MVIAMLKRECPKILQQNNYAQKIKNKNLKQKMLKRSQIQIKNKK
jgi:hypothetical protein